MIRELQYKGSFYPEEVEDIENFIDKNLENIEKIEGLRGIIVPHAGWIYSGHTASKGFSHIPKDEVKKIYLIGPSHRFYFKGVALSSYSEYETPFGNYTLDKEYQEKLLEIPGVGIVDEAHIYEHSLEVELPFLKKIYPNAKLIPIVAGANSTTPLNKIIHECIKTKDSFIVISSDLSHYKPYKVAKEVDLKSIKKIVSASGPIDSNSACGSVIINALFDSVNNGTIKLELIDYTNSGDTAGDKDSVVGYCSMEILSCG